MSTTNTIQDELNEMNSGMNANANGTPYSVSDDFFQSNIDNLGAFTSENGESLILSFIEKEMPYQVPTGYFANLPEQILEKVSDRGGKVIPMVRRKWMRLAVAAAVTGIVAISGIFYFNNRRSNSVASNDPSVIVKKATTQELNNFLKTTTIVDVNDISRTTATAPKTERKKLFNDVSDKELKAFLNQVPTDDDDLDIN